MRGYGSGARRIHGHRRLSGCRRKAHDIDTVLEPLEAAYLDGIQPIEGGDYAAAVDLLAPAAQQAPGLRETVTRLEDARRLLAAELGATSTLPRLLATGQPQSKRCANWFTRCI